MRKLALIALAAAFAVPSTASAATTGPPSACDYIKNTICQYIPPDSVEDACGILAATTQYDCSIVAVERPQVPSSCEYLANTACHYLPPDSVADICGLLETSTGGRIACTVSRS